MANDGPRYRKMRIEASMDVYFIEPSPDEESTKILGEQMLANILAHWKDEGYVEGWTEGLTVERSKVDTGFFCGCGTQLVHTPSKNWCTKCNETKRRAKDG